MDILIRTIWPNTSTQEDISIPQYNSGDQEDNVDLQVKSLIYLFKRLQIDKLSHFNPTHEFTLDHETIQNADKLDIVYNLERFLVKFTDNQHRILIDWYKNRFRAFMILSQLPAKANVHEKLARNFRFQVLRLESTQDEYVKALINSDLYIEHSVSLETKTQLALSAIEEQKQLKPSYKTQFNKTDRSQIILKYLERLSQYVQIDRIYQVSLIQKTKSLQAQTIAEEPETESSASGLYRPRSSRSPTRKPIQLQDTSSPTSTASVSPVRKVHNTNSTSTTGVTNKLQSLSITNALNPTSTQSSPSASNASPISLRSRSTSPVKTIRKKQSMTLLKLDSSLPDKSTGTTIGDTNTTLTKEENDLLYSNAERAVLSRVERELKVLN
ncbi:hypothetical protein WICPIJ_002529 [Wickerhamomyces pijperi]|uniref:Uncharacterized protein n=1 Tax=Wickerhamomyces pijperi TaxID=599730 RepID=A0A9P8QBA7_WICPI|nr:hypothetical protein WICPIJ_002529 [Wickerhamomyces pijperi]